MVSGNTTGSYTAESINYSNIAFNNGLSALFPCILHQLENTVSFAPVRTVLIITVAMVNTD